MPASPAASNNIFLALGKPSLPRDHPLALAFLRIGGGSSAAAIMSLAAALPRAPATEAPSAGQ